MNIGPRGVYGTASIPGTGISYRERFGGGSETQPQPSAPVLPPSADPHSLPPIPSPVPTPGFFSLPASAKPVQEVHSASTELLTSNSLKDLKQVIQTAYVEHEDISGQLETARQEKARASQRFLSWESGFLFKKLFKAKFAKRKAEAETATAKVAELEEQLRLTTIATQVEIAPEQAEPISRCETRSRCFRNQLGFGTSNRIRQPTSSMSAQRRKHALTDRRLHSRSETAI
jgi:hypothetical protein